MVGVIIDDIDGGDGVGDEGAGVMVGVVVGVMVGVMVGGDGYGGCDDPSRSG